MTNILVTIIVLISTPFIEYRCLVRNIYFESRSESYIGQIAVARSTLNRVYSNNFPNSVCQVVSQEAQFSWYKKHSKEYMSDMKAINIANKAAFETISGYYDGMFQHVLFYHRADIHPIWANNLKKVVTIDNHIFYKYREH